MSRGISKVVQRIEQEILFDRFYALWVVTSPKGKELARRKLRRIIKEELLGIEFRIALAKDILSEEGIRLDSHLSKYLKNRVYRGNLREMLGDLQSIEEDRNGIES